MVKPATTKLSSKGQVVIPEEIRRRLGLKPGAQFLVVGEADFVVLKALEAPDSSEFQDLVAKARASADGAGMTPDEVDLAVRDARRDS